MKLLLLLTLILSISCSKDGKFSSLEKGEVDENSVRLFSGEESAIAEIKAEFKRKLYLKVREEADKNCLKYKLGRIVMIDERFTGYGFITHYEVSCEKGYFNFRSSYK